MFKNVAKHDIFTHFENPDLPNVQNDVKHAKNYRKLIFSIFFENLDLDLSFGEGFDGIHQLQILNPKVVLFGTFSKIESKIRKNLST